ncbi:hypothetical protein QFZ77_002317 [Paenibacillus sp. V4I3]|uniref:heparinase II/III domain-containing protein n=1 Tax=Paenibacillus sp. V4I3 TaxID=3042305 RepID=UPI0027808FA7|nr:heparinase II/III family protein [Paenibacillus sp. V4I3]MDQ0873658.1 hypothetical protein [Paenibacillus sp. V4I3]
MGRILGNLEELRSRIYKDTGKIRDLWTSMEERVREHTKSPGLMQPGDTQEWWHLIWERLSDAAFVQAVKPSEELQTWLREIVLEVCDKPINEWIGPWFRSRSLPLMGTLETAHTSIAIAIVIDLCPELFSDEELLIIKVNLRTKGMDPCKAAANQYLNARDQISNWFMVLLNGIGTVAAVLDDRETVAETVEYYKAAAMLYNEDSYGESVQYSNYATIHLSHLREILTRYDPNLEENLDIGCYAKLMPWYAASFMYMKPLEGWGLERYPRTVNFGDSSAMFRPSGDVLLHVAARAKRQFPIESGIARWLFERMYANPRLGPDEGASFGFNNSSQFLSILLYQEAAEALTPEQAGIPLLSSFEVGNIIARDRWERPVTVLAIQGGFKPHHITAHRHEDQNSFILSHRQERFFVDPGHCCYRLRTQDFTKSTTSHNTWSFEAEDKVGNPFVIEQKPVHGNIYKPTSLFNHNRIVKELDGIHVVRSDAAELYGEPIRSAERTWIAAMPHTLFIIDRIQADRPVKVRSHFVINNRDNRLKAKVAAETKLVFRRNEAGMKFFQVSATSDGEINSNRLSLDWGYVHDCYHPLPNQKGQGAEGSASIFRYKSERYQTQHTIIYAIAMDDTETVRHWHILPLSDHHFYVEPPAKTGGYSLQLMENEDLIVKDHSSGREYLISQSDMTPR